nr:reverse transcriptase domain-containing protein [Tanacetum cinerariifolium]
MADNRTMEEMRQAPMEGYGDAIVVPDIFAENFEIKTGLLLLIQANQFHGFESNNPHDHIRSFNRITSTLKFRNVSNDAIKLMFFPYSLELGAKIWIDKLTDTISNLFETFNKKMTTLATVKAVEKTCVTCGGAHLYYDCIATDSNTSSACVATAYHKEKMLLCKQEEAGFQLNAEQADWRDDTDDEPEDQEIEAHYMYMAQIQEPGHLTARLGCTKTKVTT